MTDPPRPDFLELADYTGVLRRRGWIALALAALGGLVAAIYLAVAPASYQATASVYVTPNSANQNVVLGSKGTSTAVNMDNEAQIVQSNTVAVLAARTLHSRLPLPALLGQVSVTVPANTAVLAITCSAPSPAGAAACAQAFARGYLAARHATAVNKLALELTQEQSKADSLESRSVALHRQIGKLAPGSADRAQAVLELKTVSAKLDTLRTNISAINASVNTNPGYIITSAEPPSGAASPQPLLYLPSGLLAGLLAGLVAAFAADRRDNRVHTVREVSRLDGLPVVFCADGRRISPPATVAQARSAVGRDYAELAQAVATDLGDRDRVLLVAGGSAGLAAGVVAANLAAALARVRADVLLVCADPRDTMTPSLLGVGEARGLAEVLGGTATVAEVTRQAAGISRLGVITPGRDPAAAAGPVRHDVVRRLVDGLRRDARYVIVCLQGSGDGADTFGLAEFADIALVVLELERTRRPGLAACLRRLNRVQTPVLGAAVLPEISTDRGPRRDRDRGALRRGALRRAPAGAAQDQRCAAVDPPRGSLTRSLPGRSQDRGRSRSEGQPPGAGRGASQSRPPGSGRAPAEIADSGRSPSGLRPPPPSRSARPLARWEPAEAPAGQPPWDADALSWDAGPQDPWDSAGSGPGEPSWGAGRTGPAGTLRGPEASRPDRREPPRNPAGPGDPSWGTNGTGPAGASRGQDGSGGRGPAAGPATRSRKPESWEASGDPASSAGRAGHSGPPWGADELSGAGGLGGWGTAGPGRPEPARPEPGRPEPGRPEPGRPGPGWDAGPGKPPSRAEPSRAEPRQAEPPRSGSRRRSRGDQRPGEQPRGEQPRGEQPRGDRSRGGQSRGGQSRGGQSRGDQPRNEQSRAPGAPARPQPPASPDQPFRVQPPWETGRNGRPEAGLTGSGEATWEASQNGHRGTATEAGRSGRRDVPGDAGQNGRPGTPWDDAGSAWPASEAGWPAGEAAWPEPMWGGWDPARSEPAGGTADPAKPDAPGTARGQAGGTPSPGAGEPARPGSWPAVESAAAGSWDAGSQDGAGSPPWGPSETWPLSRPASAPVDPRRPGPADPPGRTAGTG